MKNQEAAHGAWLFGKIELQVQHCCRNWFGLGRPSFRLGFEGPRFVTSIIIRHHHTWVTLIAEGVLLQMRHDDDDEE